MEAIEALIVARAVERVVFMLCGPLLLYVGYRLIARAWDDSAQARADLRDKYKFQPAAFLPGAACVALGVVIGFVLVGHPLTLSKAEQDIVAKAPPTGAPGPSPGATGAPTAKAGAGGKGSTAKDGTARPPAEQAG